MNNSEILRMRILMYVARAGLNERTLAKKADISVKKIHKIYVGGVLKLSPDTVEAIAAALEVPVCLLYIPAYENVAKEDQMPDFIIELEKTKWLHMSVEERKAHVFALEEYAKRISKLQ